MNTQQARLHSPRRLPMMVCMRDFSMCLHGFRAAGAPGNRDRTNCALWQYRASFAALNGM